MAIDYAKHLRKRTVLAHEMVANVAREMANEVYEELAKNNEFYEQWPTRSAWEAASMPRFLGYARQTLAGMLGKMNVSDDDKERIYEALRLDNTLPKVN